VITERDPAGMTEAERFAQIAEILAAGYVRLLISRHSGHDRLADDGQREASCGSNATSPRSNENAA